MSEKPISPLRRRMIEDMTIRGFGEKTQNDYIRHVKTFTIFLGRAPDQAEPEHLRAYQLHQRESRVQPPTMNSAVEFSGEAKITHRNASRPTSTPCKATDTISSISTVASASGRSRTGPGALGARPGGL